MTILPIIVHAQSTDTVKHTKDQIVVVNTDRDKGIRETIKYSKKKIDIVCSAGSPTWSIVQSLDPYFINTTGQNFSIKCFFSGRPTFYYGIGAQVTIIPYRNITERTTVVENIFGEMNRVFKVGKKVYVTGGLLAGVSLINDIEKRFIDADKQTNSMALLYGFDMGIEYKFGRKISARVEVGANVILTELSSDGNIIWPASIGFVYHSYYTRKKVKHSTI